MIIGVFLGVLSASIVLGSMAIAVVFFGHEDPKDFADASNPNRVAWGRGSYNRHCAACHGQNLEGEEDWRRLAATGRRPAPPHDENGETWQHSDWELFDIVMLPNNELQHHQIARAQRQKISEVQSSAGDVLGKAQIRATIAYIKSTWPEDIRILQKEFNDRSRRLAKSN